MNLQDFKKSFYSALVFFGTILLLSVGYSALVGGLTTADRVGSGSGLTATSWNRIIDGVLNLDTRVSSIEGKTLVGGVLSAGKIQLLDTVIINAACTPDGLMARDSGGALLSCQSGTWKKQFNFITSNLYTASNGAGSPTITCPAGSFLTQCTAQNLASVTQSIQGSISGNTCTGSPILQGVYAVCVSFN